MSRKSSNVTISDKNPQKGEWMPYSRENYTFMYCAICQHSKFKCGGAKMNGMLWFYIVCDPGWTYSDVGFEFSALPVTDSTRSRFNGVFVPETGCRNWIGDRKHALWKTSWDQHHLFRLQACWTKVSVPNQDTIWNRQFVHLWNWVWIERIQFPEQTALCETTVQWQPTTEIYMVRWRPHCYLNWVV